MSTLKTIIKIAKGDYDVLVEQGSITKGGVVYTYDPDETLYMVDDGLSDDYVVLGGGSGKLLSWFASQEDISNVKSQITNVQSDLGTSISSVANSVSSLSSRVDQNDLTYYNAYILAIENINAQSLAAFDVAGRLLSIQTVYGTDTNHIATTTPFRPDNIVLPVSSVSAGSHVYGRYIYSKYDSCDIRYNFNTTVSSVISTTIYLVGKLDSETGLFTLRQTPNDYYLFFTNPTTTDKYDLSDWFDTGYDYIRIGSLSSYSKNWFTLDEHNEVFHFDGTNLVPVSIIDTHNTSKNVITGNANSSTNNAATNGNVYLNHIETTPTGKPSVTSSHKIEGVGGTNVSSDANGNITIKNHDVSYATSENDTRGHWTVTIPGITELYDGLKINVRLSTQWYGNGESYNTLNVNGLGPQLVWYRPGERLTSHYYSKYSECTLTYWSSNCGSYTVTTTTGELVKGQTYTGGWMCEYAYYTTDVSNLNTGLSRPTTASALGTHHLCALDKSGRVISLVSPVTSYSSSNPFTPTATAFRPEYIYITAGSFNSGVTISDGYLYTNRMYCYTNYNFNSNPTAAISTIYLVGTLDKTTGLFTLDQSTTGYYLYVPCNADISDLKTYFTAGKYYICIGQSYATSSVYFSKWQNNTVYYFDGTNLVSVIAKAEKAKTADEATALSTGTVGALDQPVYFSEGQPVACTDIATKSEVAIKKYPAVTDGYYYGLMDSDENPNKVTEGVDAKGAVALGCNNTIGNRFTFVTGTNNTVSGNSAVAIGQKNTTSGACSFAGGVNNAVSGNYSAIFGNSNTVSGNYANAFGAGNTVSKAGSAAIGLDNIVSSQAAFAEGNGNIICGNASHAEGGRNIAYGATSHAGGSSTSAIGYSSVTYGGSWGMNIYLTGDANATTYTYTLGEADVDPAYRLIVGNGLYLQASPYTTAYITAVDTTNKTITLSTTFNASTALSGQACWLFGTIAKGQYSFAMRGISNGASSWTVNRGGLAIGNNSFVGGNVNIANNNNEVAFGSYNLSNTGTKASAFTLGGGTEESDRKNIFEITSDGSIYASGLGSYTGTNPTSSKSIQEVISEINTTLSGKANTSHTHTKSQITDFPTSMKNPNALTIKLNGTSQGAYDGSSAKEINITASSVGAATASDITTAINNLDANPEGSSSQGIKVQVKQTDGKVSGVTVSQSNTFATLGTDGKVPSSQLPSYVDDVLEFASKANFPDPGETGKIYVATDTNLTYRWTGSTYVEISQSLALGTTSSTAYYGDKGKVAYDHSQVTTGNPHKVTKSDVGLSNVDNTADSAKSVKYATSAGSASTAGNASTATKLQTPRTISLGTGVTSTATSFSGESNITIPVNSIKESYLDWGGKNIQGNISPLGMSISAEHSANRLAFINGDALTFEYSSDGGSTWTDYNYPASTKSAWCTLTSAVPIGRHDNTTDITLNMQTRVTLTAQDGTSDNSHDYVYTNPRKLLIQVSSSCGQKVKIEYKTGSGASWITFGEYALSGWSGWNEIPLVLNTLGGSYNQTGNIWYLRLTFIITALTTSTYTKQSDVTGIRLFGTNDWYSASAKNGKGPMSSTGHLYSYDISANATFPAAITAKGNGIFYSSIYEGGTSSSNLLSNRYAAKSHTHSYAGSSSAGGAATSANKLNTDAGNTTTPVYFSNGVPVALGYTIAKSVPSSAVFTDTHYSSSSVVTGNVNSNTNNAATNGNVRLNHVENSAVTSSHIIKGTGATTVTSDASGTITINSTDTNTDTKVTAVGNHYTPSKSTTKSASGGTLTDITNSSGTNVVTGVEMDAAGHVTGVTSVALKSTNTNTTYSAGTGISLSGTTFSNSGVRSVSQGSNGYVNVNTNGTSSTVAVYSLPTATSSQLGGVVSQTTGTTANRDYKVEVASDGKMKVNVPWTDTNTTYSTGTATTSGLTKLYTSTGTNTDGTMTQSAINTALSGKADSSHNHNDIYYTEAEMNTKLSSKVDNTAAGVSTALNKLTEGTSTPSDSDYYISQYAGGGTTTTTYHRRPLSALWTWIKSKLATVATSGSYTDLSNKPTSLKNPSVLAIGTADTPIISYDGSEVKGLTIKGSGATTVTGDATANSITISSTGVDYTAGTGISISGTTISNSGVTGVKGAADSVYKTGNVNLTPANIGAASASHTHKKSQITDFSVTTADIVNGAVTADKLAAESIIPTKINHDTDNYWSFHHLSSPTGDIVVGDAGGGTYKDIQLSNANSANGVPILTVQGYDGEAGQFFYDTTLRGINTPTEDNDAANKGYVDNSINSLAVATTTANGLMSATDKSRIDKLSVYTFDFDEINKDVGDSVSSTVVDSIRDMLFANIGCIVAAVYGQYKTGACDTRYPVAAEFLNYGSDTNYSININIYAGTTVYRYDILRDASSCTIDSKSTYNLINTSQLTKGGTTSMSNGGVWTAVNAPVTLAPVTAITTTLTSSMSHRIMNLATTAVTQTYTLPASPAAGETFEFYKMFTASTLTIKSTDTNMYNTRTGSTTKVSSITYSSTYTPSRCKIVCMYVSGAWWVTIENLAT